MPVEDELNEIEQEFLAEWELFEQFFSRLAVEHEKIWQPAYHLFTELRKRGYDKKLRPGKSLLRFILSRSREYGLRSNQPRIGIVFRDGSMRVAYFAPPDEVIRLDYFPVELTSEVEDLLARLMSHPID